MAIAHLFLGNPAHNGCNYRTFVDGINTPDPVFLHCGVAREPPSVLSTTMVLLSRLILSSILAASGALAQEGDPVCIVGAGPAGLSAAKALEDKGRDVVIFEKREAVGGKSQAVNKE